MFLAIGAAVATAVLVAGITLGPTVYSCAQGDDFGSCFSQSLFDDGATAPAPAPMAAAPSGPEQEIPARTERGTETAAETAAPVMEAEPGDAGVGPASAPQQQESADPEPEAVPAPPSVDLVRVEPDGSAVIAGNASSGAVVELYANDALIGDETADTGGAWVYVTESPLPAGGVDLRVLDTETGLYASTSIVVVVAEDRTSEPLVVAIAEGEPTEILQGLDRPESGATQPEEEPVAPVEAEAVGEMAPEPEAPAEITQEPVFAEEDAPQIAAVQGSEDAAPAGQAVEPDRESDVAAAPPAEAGSQASPEVAIARHAEEGEAVAAAPVEQPQAAPETQVALAPAAAPESLPEVTVAPTAEPVRAPEVQPGLPGEPAPVAGPEAEVAAAPAAEPTPPANEPAITILPPTIDAIEVDGDRTFFAGAGADGFTVRLYVDNVFVADAPVDDGRWLVESSNVFDAPSQRVRADLIDGSGRVLSRAEVNFVLPEPQPAPASRPETPAIAVAEGEPPAAAAEPAPREEPAAHAAPEAMADTGVAPGAVTVAGVPVSAPDDAASRDLVAPRAEASQAPTVVPIRPEGHETGAPGIPQAQAGAADVAGAVLQDAAPAPAPQDAASVPAEESASVPTLFGVQDGDRVVTGRVIIRRGDNLWTIARRVYGAGIRYTQIYEANADQIRDPDLIYPGQVFGLPETDVVIGDPVAPENP